MDIQLNNLQYCDKIFQENVSSLSSKRTQLQACLEYVCKGDVLIVTRLNQWGRSTLYLSQIAEELQRKGMHLQVIDQNIDTSDATDRLLFNMLGAIGQFENEICAERQMDGILKAKARAVQFGLQRKLFDEQRIELKQRRENGKLVKDLMADYGISKATLYHYL